MNNKTQSVNYFVSLITQAKHCLMAPHILIKRGVISIFKYYCYKYFKTNGVR